MIPLSAYEGTVVCTMCEGGYHHGVATLYNSLHAAGYEGHLLVACRGALPPWAPAASGAVGVVTELSPVPTLRVSFVKFEPVGHFANFKPHFMLEFLNRFAPRAGRIVFFDPDINVECDWGFFERWIDGGIALAEDPTPPLPERHPKRVAWRAFFSPKGIDLHFRDERYANGGFVGLDRKDQRFLELWKQMTELMGEAIGGLGVTSLAGGQKNEFALKYGQPFDKTDQDVLNCAAEAFDGNVAHLGKEVMGFVRGGHVMTHALGKHKPWNKPFIRSALKGKPPSRADAAYWRFSKGPIQSMASGKRKTSLARLAIAKIIGRFYEAKW